MKITKKLKQAWNWLDGKKTTIGATLSTGLFLLNIISPGTIPAQTYADAQGVIAFWTGFGLLAKAKKKSW